MTGIALPILGFLYAHFKGFKIASLDKRKEYNKLKEVVGALTENISKEEFMAIVAVVLEKKKSKAGFTVADAQQIGMMVYNAVITEEVKK